MYISTLLFFVTLLCAENATSTPHVPHGNNDGKVKVFRQKYPDHTHSLLGKLKKQLDLPSIKHPPKFSSSGPKNIISPLSNWRKDGGKEHSVDSYFRRHPAHFPAQENTPLLPGLNLKDSTPTLGGHTSRESESSYPPSLESESSFLGEHSSSLQESRESERGESEKSGPLIRVHLVDRTRGAELPFDSSFTESSLFRSEQMSILSGAKANRRYENILTEALDTLDPTFEQRHGTSSYYFHLVKNYLKLKSFSGIYLSDRKYETCLEKLKKELIRVPNLFCDDTLSLAMGVKKLSSFIDGIWGHLFQIQGQPYAQGYILSNVLRINHTFLKTRIFPKIEKEFETLNKVFQQFHETQIEKRTFSEKLKQHLKRIMEISVYGERLLVYMTSLVDEGFRLSQISLKRYKPETSKCLPQHSQTSCFDYYPLNFIKMPSQEIIRAIDMYDFAVNRRHKTLMKILKKDLNKKLSDFQDDVVKSALNDYNLGKLNNLNTGVLIRLSHEGEEKESVGYFMQASYDLNKNIHDEIIARYKGQLQKIVLKNLPKLEKIIDSFDNVFILNPNLISKYHLKKCQQEILQNLKNADRYIKTIKEGAEGFDHLMRFYKEKMRNITLAEQERNV